MTTAGATQPVKGQRKTKVGRVVSDKSNKTIVVSVERLTRHRLYKRVMKASTKFAAHKLPVATRVVVRDTAKEVTDGDR